MEDKISIKEILRYFWKKKILALIIIIVTFIVSFMGLSFYNNAGVVYTSSFKLTWNGYATEQYPDSSKFNYTNLIGKENLERAKASSDEFANINIDRMLEKGKVEIKEVDVYLDKVLTSTHYTINFSASCFNSRGQASRFVQAIILAHEEHVADLVRLMDIDNDLDRITDETEYEELFTSLAIQKNNIYDIIAKLQKVRSLDFIYDKETGKTIRWIKNELQDLYDNYTYHQLPYRYRSDYLVRNSETFTEIFEKQLLALNVQIEQKQAYLDELKNQFGSETILGDLYLEKVMNLVSEIGNLKNKKDYLVTCINNPVEDKEYETAVQKIYDKLIALNSEIKKAQIAVYIDEIDHIFAAGAQVVEEVEPIGTIMSGVIALGVSVVLCAGVIVIMAMNNNVKIASKKEENLEKK